MDKRQRAASALRDVYDLVLTAKGWVTSCGSRPEHRTAEDLARDPIELSAQIKAKIEDFWKLGIDSRLLSLAVVPGRNRTLLLSRRVESAIECFLLESLLVAESIYQNYHSEDLPEWDAPSWLLSDCYGWALDELAQLTADDGPTRKRGRPKKDSSVSIKTRFRSLVANNPKLLDDPAGIVRLLDDQRSVVTIRRWINELSDDHAKRVQFERERERERD